MAVLSKAALARLKTVTQAHERRHPTPVAAAEPPRIASGMSLVKLLEDLEEDGEADAVLRWMDAGGSWVNDSESRKFKVHGWEMTGKKLLSGSYAWVTPWSGRLFVVAPSACPTSLV